MNEQVNEFLFDIATARENLTAARLMLVDEKHIDKHVLLAKVYDALQWLSTLQSDAIEFAREIKNKKELK